MANTIKSRILLKSDTSANWDKAANSFIPKLGEICIYLDWLETTNSSNETVYIPGVKIGDGTSFINELEFINDSYISNEQIDNLFA